MRVYESESHPYSEVRMSEAGIAYVSGVLPYDDDGVVEQDKERAPAVALAVLSGRLEAAGLTLREVMKATVFVTDIAMREEVNRVFRASFNSPMPARTVVEVRKLPQGAPIEIDAIAHRPINSESSAGPVSTL